MNVTVSLAPRFSALIYGKLITLDNANLNILWLCDESIEDSPNQPDLDLLAAEIMEDLRAALDQSSSITGELSPDSTPDP
jgi:type I restriction enzyme M protein